MKKDKNQIKKFQKKQKILINQLKMQKEEPYGKFQIVMIYYKKELIKISKKILFFKYIYFII